MLNSFSFKNYKAFREGKIEIRPITILLGPNSVGKSSILQFIMMIAQTLLKNRRRPYIKDDKNKIIDSNNVLKLNGDCVRLGENENIFFNKGRERVLEISFNYTHNKNIFLFNPHDLLDYFEYRIDSFLEILYSLSKSISNNENNNFLKKGKKRKKLLLNQKVDELENLKNTINSAITESEINVADLISDIVKKDWGSYVYSKKLNRIILETEQLRNVITLFENISKSSDSIYEMTFEILLLKGSKLGLNRIRISIDGKTLIDYSGHVKGTCSLKSDFLANSILKCFAKEINDNICVDNLSFDFKNRKNGVSLKRRSNNESESMISIFAREIINCMIFFSENISYSICDKVNHVSPLRALPKRFYLFDEINSINSLGTIDGNQLTNILKKEKGIKKSVNKWLSKFGLSVNVDELETFVHKIKVNQNNLEFDIVDVGFGLSQVLPVIVQGFLTRDDSITLVEQPEIHLHPKMQADLGDLFIDIVKAGKNQKRMIIETHSEYLLKRIRRRMAEGIISHEDVAIYFIHPCEINNEGAKIERIKINETGNFNWPKDFYCNDLEDTIEFLKYQK